MLQAKLAADGGGHLICLEWARATDCVPLHCTCCCVVKGGHLSVLRWARKRLAAHDKIVFRKAQIFVATKMC